MDILAGFIMAVVGSLHCVGMCGPIAMLLPTTGASGGMLLVNRLTYNLGRVASYALLGVAAGIIGRAVALAGYQQTLSIVLGLAVIISVLGPAALRRWFATHRVTLRLEAALKKALSALFRRRSLSSTLLLGVANGLLPCGLVYVALAAGATLGSVAESVVFMTGFGLGTLPVMMGISLAAPALPSAVRGKLHRIIPVVTVVVGVLLVLRGLNLGIPYVSPAVQSADVTSGEGHCH